jgi:two-component system sensor histidine kinase PilS (NtrC family)
LPGLLPFFSQSTSESVRLQQVVEIELQNQKRILRGDVAKLEEGSELAGLLHSEEGRVLLFQDVTQMLHLEEKLKQSEKLAAVGQLAAGIAHEIRNPLAGMSASIEMLRSSLPREAVAGENQKLMDIALREIDRLNHLISEFLDYVKPQQWKKEPVELSKLLADILLALRHPEKPGKIHSLKGGISVRTDIELKENYTPSVLARANPEKLKQVVWNLVINAIQSMDKQGSIEVGCERVGNGQVKFWVRDQGQGMDEKTLSHLYEPFFTTKEKGTGLGLATAYKIVESFQGEIRVQSVKGQGTYFEVFLPAA